MSARHGSDMTAPREWQRFRRPRRASAPARGLAAAILEVMATTNGSWDGAGVWDNVHLRPVLRARGHARDLPDGALSERVSMHLTRLERAGRIRLVTDRLAAPGGRTRGGRIYRLALRPTHD
jgi:hypothetical protein